MRLGGARADFVASLGRKVTDLRSALLRVRETPTDTGARDDLRRKLHALASGAKLMKFDAMERSISDALGMLDRTAKEAALSEANLDDLEQVLEDLPALAWGEERHRLAHSMPVPKTVTATYSALVIGAPSVAEALLERLDGRPTFACKVTPDAQAAFDLARANDPDLIVLDGDLDYAPELVEALMDDASTEGAPIVVVGSFLESSEAARFVAMGVAKTLAKPISRDALRDACERALEPARVSAAPATLGELTLDQLGEFLAGELKNALVGKVDAKGRDERIALGEGTEVLSALWGTIARVREVVTSRTNGNIRFDLKGPEGALAIASPLDELDVARADRARARARGAGSEVRLTGRRVVVADDDPAVVWFMADLLRTAGCVVHEAFDGEQALEAAYRTTPDIIISDVLMPKVDGFSLCRALRRDVALRDVPVVLLSWKEDLLQRVRELGAGAAGYVRKESDTRAIVARVREALRPRTRIEARLSEEGEVRGRLDSVSVRTLLEIVCATRPDARVSVRDASFLYEVEIRSGAPLRATRTSSDGSFLGGSRVLSLMLGVGAGKFTVATSTSPIDADLDGNLASQLVKPIARARAATALLAGSRLHPLAARFSSSEVARIRFDDTSLHEYLRATPVHARELALRMAEGMSPRRLVLEGACEASLVEDIVCDLASRGVVIGIENEEGYDLLGPAIAELASQGDSRAAFAPRTQTPVPASAERVRDEVVHEELTHAELFGDEENDVSPTACTVDAAPFCESPEPPASATSLEDAVMREVNQRSPVPADVLESSSERSSVDKVLVEPSELKQRLSPLPSLADEDEESSWQEGTPSRDEILAMAEATVIDDTSYGERELSVPVALEPSRSMPLAPAESEPSKADDDARDEEPKHADDAENSTTTKTPFTAVTAQDAAEAGLPKARRSWPMVAFVTATAAVAWGVMHFTGSEASLPKQVETSPPPAPTTMTNGVSTVGVTYAPVAAEATVTAGQGVLDVTAREGRVILVDGVERGRGSVTLPLWAGAHEIRVSGESDAHRTVDVREGQVARIVF
ncbi:putative response regulator [Labilithrix luteola]|uniref:Putative response regulator n=1 Tax=Labilithrix luteola TaxID=1391654 RepID=A0A0K1PVK3_9BACT|nr:response regulator [Labilithrix luteola]AKU97557.1 putative response regulator [Labilithrix luteola]